MQKFKAHIRKSKDNQYYSVLVGRNGEDVYVQETRRQKRSVIKMVKAWFPDCEIVDETLKTK